MKTIGGILIITGIAFLIFVVYSLMQNQNDLLSPLPDETGIKVIYVSPTKSE